MSGLMGEMSSRVAQRKTGVSHNAIARVRAGDIPTQETLLRIAAGFGVDPNLLLEAASYPRIETGRAVATLRTGDVVRLDFAGPSVRITPELMALLESVARTQPPEGDAAGLPPAEAAQGGSEAGEVGESVAGADEQKDPSGK
jgi:transcriptional regulator with XRE-family HTH domain